MMRTAGDPNAMIAAVRSAVQQIDPDVPLAGMTTQTEQLEGRFAQERLFAMAYSLFGGLALLLACIGLFGLMSYSVSRRTNEIGIRMALGAQRGGVIGMVLRESMMMVAIGVVLGLVRRGRGRTAHRQRAVRLDRHRRVVDGGRGHADDSRCRSARAICPRDARRGSIR